MQLQHIFFLFSAGREEEREIKGGEEERIERLQTLDRGCQEERKSYIKTSLNV